MKKRLTKADAKNDGIATLLLLHMVDQAYSKQAWHGPNLKGSVKGVSAEIALKRPAPGRHNIYELVCHAAYWKYIVWRKLTGVSKTKFEIKGSNWFRSPESADEKDWLKVRKLLDHYHDLVKRAIHDFPVELLEKQAPNSKYEYYAFICGMASHDLYHAGQIQLIKRIITHKGKK